MDYLERIKKAIDFVEENLTNNIKVEQIAEQSCFSQYHFYRLFVAFTGETVGDYLRKRRLTKAAIDLLETNEKIKDIAFDYAFESPEAFTRSFKRQFRISPTIYRKLKQPIWFFRREKITKFKLNYLQNRITMKPEIKTIDNFSVVGMEIQTNLKDNKIPQLWMSFMPRMQEIKHINSKNVGYGICKHDENISPETFTDDTIFTSVASMGVDKVEDVPEGMFSLEVKGGKFAVFTHKGNLNNLKTTYEYIYGTWLPNSSFELDKRDDFERYDNRFMGPENNASEMEIWIPVK